MHFDGLYDHVLIRSECQHGGRVAYCAFSCMTPDELIWFAVRSAMEASSHPNPFYCRVRRLSGLAFLIKYILNVHIVAALV